MVGSSWWKAHLKLLPTFKEILSCKGGSGHTIKLWHDIWIDQPLKWKFPELYSFARNDTQCLKYMVNCADIYVFFHTPLSAQAFAQAFAQLNELQLLISQHTNWQNQDMWICSNNNKTY